MKKSIVNILTNSLVVFAICLTLLFNFNHIKPTAFTAVIASNLWQRSFL